MPTFEQFQDWAAQVAPNPGFRFAVKASRFITHLKKLKDPQESIARLLAAANGLGEHGGMFLYQLPPGWHADLNRLEDFLEHLPREHPAAFEFRDPSWFEPATLPKLEQLLKATHAALAIGVGGASPTPPHLPRIGPFARASRHLALCATRTQPPIVST